MVLATNTEGDMVMGVLVGTGVIDGDMLSVGSIEGKEL